MKRRPLAQPAQSWVRRFKLSPLVMRTSFATVNPRRPAMKPAPYLLAQLLVLATLVLLDARATERLPGAGRVQLITDLQGFSGSVSGVCFSPDELHVAACGGKEVRLWDLQTGQLHYTLRGQIDGGDAR